jgi:hypothetical protein
MPDPRWKFIADKVAALDATLSLSQRICSVALELLRARSISLALAVNHAYSPIADSDPLGTLLDEEQFSLGDGPTFDAQSSPAPIILEDIRAHQAATRWPIFAKLAQAHEVHGVFAFPLRIGDAYLGVLTAYLARAGRPTAAEFADGLILSSLATAEVLRHLADAGPESEAGILQHNLYDQPALQIAAGMVAESLDIPIVAALVRIRARAFADGQPVNYIAQRIVARTLTLDN